MGYKIDIKINNWQIVHSNEFVKWLFTLKLEIRDCSPDVVKKKKKWEIFLI